MGRNSKSCASKESEPGVGRNSMNRHQERSFEWKSIPQFDWKSIPSLIAHFCMMSVYVMFAIGPQVFQVAALRCCANSLCTLKFCCNLQTRKEECSLHVCQQLRPPAHSMRPLLDLASQRQRPMGIPLVHTEILRAFQCCTIQFQWPGKP